MWFKEFNPWTLAIHDDHSNTWDTICNDQHEGYVCTRAPEHAAEHEASVGEGQIAARWGVDTDE